MVFKSKKDERRPMESFTPTYTPPPPPRVTSNPVTVTDSGSFIGITMDIKADITSDEDITIEGKVTGNISISKTLTIGKSGQVKADIKAAVVRIIGEAKGNIVASEKVEILSQGRYTGNIQSKKLVVADGAILNGNINEEQT